MEMDVILDLNGVSVYQGDFLVLKEVDITIRKGEFVYLIGKTGTGKSSLLKTIYGELPVKQGSAYVSGYDLTRIRRKQIPFLRRSIGIVFQDFQLLTDRTVHENLLFVLKATGWKKKDQMNDRITDVLDKVGLATKGFKMPHQLSGGEQQRIVIARALLNDPDMILADEPTGNLDSKTSTEIMRLLEDIHKNGNTIILVTHEEEIAQHAKRIIRLRDGLIESDEKTKAYELKS